MFCIVLTLVGSYNPIGYETVGEFLHTWNNNPLCNGEFPCAEANIWFNSSSGYMQFFNGETLYEARDRSSWLTNSFGLATYAGSDFVYLSKDHLGDYEMELDSDFSTYWKQDLWKCVDFGPVKKFCVGWRRGQKTDDIYMKNNFHWLVNESTPFTYNRPLWYVHEFKNISIENDGDDLIIYCYDDFWSGDDYVERCDSFEFGVDSFEKDNVTMMRIIDSTTKEGHWLVTNETKARLRYEGGDSVMLLFPINNGVPMVGWTGHDSIKTYWIDAVSEEINGDFINEQSGYIMARTTLGTTYSAVNNTGQKVGRTKVTGTEWWRGYTGWNINDTIPKNADITSIAVHFEVSSIAGSVTSWKSKLYSCGDNCVADNHGLEAGPGANKGDWDDGNYTGYEVIWNDFCGGGNQPCSGDHVLWAGEEYDNTSLHDLNKSIQNNYWYMTSMRDSSDYLIAEQWTAIFDIGVRNRLIVNFTVPDGGLNVNQTNPVNNSVITTTQPTINLNLTGIAGGDYTIDLCYFNLNGSVTVNGSNVNNGTVGLGSLAEAGTGAYWWEINCTDVFNFEAFSGRSYFNISKETSIYAVDFHEVSDFAVSNADYEEKIQLYFNTSEELNLTLFTTMNLVKVSGGGTNVLSTRIKVDNNEVLEEALRSMSTVNDIGSTGTKPFVFNVSAGQHNLTMDWKRSGEGIVDVENLDIILVEFKSVLGNPIRQQITEANFGWEGTDEEQIFNWTVQKSVLSGSYYYTKQTINESSVQSTTATFYIKDIDSVDEESPRWLRWLQNQNDVGSLAGLWAEEEDYFGDNHSIVAQQTRAGASVSVNSSIIDFDFRDSETAKINAFHVTNETANGTTTITLPAGTHIIANVTKTIVNATGYFLSAGVSIESSVGGQTPTIFINSSEGGLAHCYTEKERYLSRTNDIGNVFMNVICHELTVGQDYTFNLGVIVPSGKNLVIYDDAFNGFEVTEFPTVVSLIEILPGVVGEWAMAIIFCIGGSGFLFLFISCKFDKEHHYIFKVFLIFIGIFLFLITSNSAATITNLENISSTTDMAQTTYGVNIWIFYVLLAAFVVGAIMYSLRKLRKVDDDKIEAI